MALVVEVWLRVRDTEDPGPPHDLIKVMDVSGDDARETAMWLDLGFNELGRQVGDLLVNAEDGVPPS